MDCAFLSKLEKKLQSFHLPANLPSPEVLKAVAGAETFHFDRAVVVSSAASVHLVKIEVAKAYSRFFQVSVHLPVGAKTFVIFCNVIHPTPQSA